MSLLIPISADHLCAYQRTTDTIHAVAVNTMQLGRKKHRRTVDTVCGIHRQPLFSGSTEDGDSIVMIWPPYNRQNDGTRCCDCWETTGRPRPHSYWTKP